MSNRKKNNTTAIHFEEISISSSTKPPTPIRFIFQNFTIELPESAAPQFVIELARELK